MKYLQSLFILVIIQCSCTESEPQIQRTASFQIYLEGEEPITFFNPECEFNKFDKNQEQYNVTNEYGYFMLSTYWNSYSEDSIANQIWIELDMDSNPPHKLYSFDSLANILSRENSSINNDKLQVSIKLKIRGKKYYNQYIGEIDDLLFFQIEDYDLNYKSGCLDKKLLYMKLQIEGQLYTYDFLTKTDSIKINSSEMNLLFASD